MAAIMAQNRNPNTVLTDFEKEVVWKAVKSMTSVTTI